VTWLGRVTGSVPTDAVAENLRWRVDSWQGLSGRIRAKILACLCSNEFVFSVAAIAPPRGEHLSFPSPREIGKRGDAIKSPLTALLR
jgi:hypothetical protein